MTTVSDLYTEAGYWHGTGRYKYGEQGEVVDILKGIIEDKGLRLHDDDWDRKRGRVESISLARSRMYARLYAGMYLPDGQRIRNEYLSRYVWGYYFFGTAKVVAFLEYPSGPHIPGYWEKIGKWTRKVSRKKHSLQSIFLQGTDVADNYPILIGIKSGVVRPMPGSRFFDLHEARSEAAISIADFTHIEVPEKDVGETTAALRAAGFDTPVIPIEQGEDYCRRFSFRALASGRPLASR